MNFKNTTRIQNKLHQEANELLQKFRENNILRNNDDKGSFTKTFTSRIVEKTFGDKHKYEGEMQVDGTRNGKGIMWFHKGDIYFGDWLND